MSLQPGAKLGPYEIEEAVGAGGMGEVYRARDTRLERSVAIKVLPAHFSEHPDVKQRFEREAKSISSLQHPHICALYDIGNESGIDFLVMEYLEGETLASRLKQGPLPTDDLLRLGVQITEALDTAHRGGVIHRDLKPGNVMLTKSGAKLLDFGLAKMSVGGTSTDSSSFTQLATQTPSGPLTEQGTVLGTFQYMSPEQLEGGEADARSDIFALGALLYEMATGQKAFAGKSQASLIASIMSAQPQPISTIQPMTPPALDRVISTCLEKDRESRWQTAHDVALQLKWIAEGGSQAGVPKPVAARRRGRERSAWIVAGVAILVAVALGAMRFLETGPEPPIAARFEIQAPDGVTSFGSPRISPNGRFIAFNGTDSIGNVMMWVRPMNSLGAYPLPGTENAERPFWSPDSRNIGFFSGTKLKRVPVAGGPPLTLCDFPRGADGAWGDGVILFDGTFGDSVNAVPAGGGDIRGASTLDHATGERAHGWPHFLPDGKQFLFIVFPQTGPNEIHVGTIGSMESKMLTLGDSRVEYVAPGYLIFERGGTLLAQRFDFDKLSLEGDAFALTEGIGAGDSGLAHFSGSRNGTLIFTQGDAPERQLVWFDRRGNELGTLGEPARYRDPALSRDEKRLAVTIPDPTSDTDDLWLIDIARGVQSRFTFDARDDYSSTWSPDGTQVLFGSDRAGNNAVYVKNAAGTGPAKLLIDHELGLSPTAWTADGRVFCFSRRPTTSADIVYFRVDAPDSVYGAVVGQFAEFQGNPAPGGRFLAYGSFETQRSEIYILALEGAGGKWQVSSSGGSEPMWRGDERELFYMAPDRGLMAVDISLEGEVQIGVPRKLFMTPVPRSGNTRNRYVVTADGQRFLMLALLERDRVPPTNVIINWTADLKER